MQIRVKKRRKKLDIIISVSNAELGKKGIESILCRFLEYLNHKNMDDIYS